MNKEYMIKMMRHNNTKYITLFYALMSSFCMIVSAHATELSGVTLLDSDDGDVVRIDADANLNYQVFDLDGPPRLVLSFPKATLKSGVQTLTASGDGVVSVVPTQTDKAARIEVGLSQVMGYDIEEKAHALLVKFKPKKQTKTSSSAAIIQDIEVQDKGGVTELVLRGSHMDANHNAFMTQKNQKLILDFWGGKSQLPKDNFKYASQRISAVSVGAADGRVRLVVSLVPSSNLHQQIDTTASEMRIKLGGVIAKKAVANMKVESVEFQPDDRIAHLMVRTDKTNPVIHVHEKGENTVILDIKKAALLPGQERSQDVSAFPGPIRQIDSYQLDGNVRVVARLREKANITSFQQGNVFTMNFEPEDMALARSSHGERKGSFAYTGQKVTFDFKDIDIQNALKLIAEMSNLNIIMADDISGSLTMRLIDVPWDQALDLILSARGLGKEVSGNVMRIAPLAVLQKEKDTKLETQRSSAKLEPLVTEFITLNYSKVDEFKDLLKANSSSKGSAGAKGVSSNGLLTARGSFSADTRTNTLIVKDTQDAINNIKRLVKRIDLPVKQVLIESRIVEATTDFKRNLGIRWGGNFKSANTGRGTNPNSGLAVSSTAGNAKAGVQGALVDLPAASVGTTAVPSVGMSFGALSKVLNLDLELSAAELDGDTHLISNPRVVTANLKQATIKQGVSIAVVTPGTANEPATTSYKDALLSLVVTPQITNNNSVIMDIKVNKDSPTGTGANIDTKSISTNILMKSGETVVIGGVYTQDKTNTTNGVPGLSRIPVLGWLFKNNAKADTRKELLIFVTPTVLNASGKAI